MPGRSPAAVKKQQKISKISDEVMQNADKHDMMKRTESCSVEYRGGGSETVMCLISSGICKVRYNSSRRFGISSKHNSRRGSEISQNTTVAEDSAQDL